MIWVLVALISAVYAVPLFDILIKWNLEWNTHWYFLFDRAKMHPYGAFWFDWTFTLQNYSILPTAAIYWRPKFAAFNVHTFNELHHHLSCFFYSSQIQFILIKRDGEHLNSGQLGIAFFLKRILNTVRLKQLADF